jgi:hypothetical protein
MEIPVNLEHKYQSGRLKSTDFKAYYRNNISLQANEKLELILKSRQRPTHELTSL